ncbi:NAD(P)H-hydrate dehydratase [Novosphingobium profundi]|uniref:NAD(P)H-hydrate dehydratase n=1 Tax=Novosphingobium profundi TaxID=1774954 RepID=UPI001CFED147|nr:NAD(P)H-hydrate dehydratase [Novosphingobium profundi]
MTHVDTYASSDQILTVAQMRAAEEALIADGISVDELMQRAGQGAAAWVWRVSGGNAVSVLCGPGNNGGDGYVIAESLRRRGGKVVVIAPMAPTTEAAKTARALYQGEVHEGEGDLPRGEVFVDCLFGSGLSRPLEDAHRDLVTRLAARHAKAVAVDMPSGIASDSGLLLNEDLPAYTLTLALGAWKFAHFLMPASARMGALRLVPIGVTPVEDAAQAIARPEIAAPPADAHKYTRGLLAVVGGAMPGAAILASTAAQGAGAGYVKLFAADKRNCPSDLVVETGPVSELLSDHRNAAILVGPGLGRDGAARERLAIALADPVPVVLDADALVLLGPRLLAERSAPVIATPHEGELVALERAFTCEEGTTRIERAVALARASGMVIVAKGPDTVIAGPEGELACAPRASAWLSTAGTGDVLAGTIASRLATGLDPFAAACEGVWLHGEAARLAPKPFTASQLAETIPAALAACL